MIVCNSCANVFVELGATTSECYRNTICDHSIAKCYNFCVTQFRKLNLEYKEIFLS